MEQSNKKAVVLLSGGLDSATTTAMAIDKGFSVYALSFSYGQRHAIEIEMAKKVAKNLDVKEHKFAKIDLRLFGGSALTDDIDVPKSNNIEQIGREIPVTYVPARNVIFLSFALGYAETIGAFDIFIGVNALDYSGYPDCRPEFIKSFENTANLAIAATMESRKLKIHTPLIDLTKAEIIAKGISLGLDYSNTISCYDPDGEISCGKCDSCLLRLKGFAQNNITDPVKYI